MDYRRGIDVSYHQGDIDWASVKASACCGTTSGRLRM